MIKPIKNKVLYGHQSAKERFLEAFNSKRVHHAWLITGERGIGKATLAYGFAKFLLQYPLYEPKDFNFTENSIIRRIEANSHPDFIAVDATYLDGEPRKQLSITIEEIREINKFVRLTATESKFKVVLVDGVDQMNINAANAMLKILEEPPANTFFFLIANSTHGILPTIRSRCMNLKLNNLSFEEYHAALKLNIPGLTSEEAQKLFHYCNGNLNLSIQLYENKAIQFVEMLSSLIDNFSYTKLLSLLEVINLEQNNWQLVKTMLFKLIEDKIKASQNQLDLGNKLDYLSSMKKKVMEAETFHLDKQHLLLSILGKEC